MVAILGAGSWGTALAVILAREGLPVELWARNRAQVAYMEAERHNPRYLQDASLPKAIHPTTDLAGALAGQDLVLHVVPSHATRDLAARYAPLLGDEAVLVSATKGLEGGTHLRMTEVLAQETQRQAGLLTGPNHAEEVCEGQPTAAVAAHPDPDVADRVADVLTTPRFKVFPRTDLAGCEVCSAYKNVVALAAGMGAGLGYGDNAVAALVTLGVDEMVAIVKHVGGSEYTCYGLAGVGDLVATATSRHSRNRAVGTALARGASLQEALGGMHGQVAEGVRAVKVFHEYVEEEGLDLPLTEVAHRIVYGRLSVREGVDELLARI